MLICLNIHMSPLFNKENQCIGKILQFGNGQEMSLCHCVIYSSLAESLFLSLDCVERCIYLYIEIISIVVEQFVLNF